jgi:hypothetical protein
MHIIRCLVGVLALYSHCGVLTETPWLAKPAGKIIIMHHSFNGIVYISDVKRDVAPYLLTLANRNDPICVVSSKVTKASTICVAVAGIIAGVIVPTFAKENTA